MHDHAIPANLFSLKNLSLKIIWFIAGEVHLMTIFLNKILSYIIYNMHIKIIFVVGHKNAVTNFS